MESMLVPMEDKSSMRFELQLLLLGVAAQLLPGAHATEGPLTEFGSGGRDMLMVKTRRSRTGKEIAANGRFRVNGGGLVCLIATTRMCLEQHVHQPAGGRLRRPLHPRRDVRSGLLRSADLPAAAIPAHPVAVRYGASTCPYLVYMQSLVCAQMVGGPGGR